MKILILGGGPGGLYAGILLKKANPDYDIRIIERNPAGATYGWGVVFSDRTVNTFREADFPSFEQITQEFVTWSAIDVHYRGQVIRAGGHDFAGMSRARLLQILQARCAALGVRLDFEREAVFSGGSPGKNAEANAARIYATGLEPFHVQPAEYDLVIAADGVNSNTRTQFQAAYQPKLSTGKARYIWFGTDRLLDAFTFLIKTSAHGLFQVHAYPFDGGTSTFIVECAEDVWQQAGLDTASEAESIAYCEELFADFLGGAGLLSNLSAWINFIEVTCKRWVHEVAGTPVVLLGDSAHTAHFSVGSGTKLAMDAAISLAQAVESAPDVKAALRLYQMDRRPRAEGLQAAARVSQRYFENLKRYTHLEPGPFAFQLLTRSGRIHYDNLRTRDPRYVDQVDRSFSGEPLASPPLFTPFTIAGLKLSNRAASHGIESGAGLVLTGPVAVTPEGQIREGDSGLWEAEQVPAMRQWVETVHQNGAKTGILLNHAGRRSPTPVAPSAIPYTRLSPVPREATEADLAEICQAFVQAAGLAAEAGFDLLQLHLAHGYLLGSFLSPLTNKRDDAYGGSAEGRLRFPLRVFDAVREAWPGPLAVALNVDDWYKGGLRAGDAVRIAKTLKEHGVDLVQPLAGQTVAADKPAYGPGYLTAYAERLRHEAGLPVLVGGYLTTTGEANTILAGGRADLCILSDL